jgi:transcriptional regulator with XRE-family HTH domain
MLRATPSAETASLATVLPVSQAHRYPHPKEQMKGARLNDIPPGATGRQPGELLGRFLRDRRTRITRDDAGHPGRRGGRSGTITQEDLARLTGYSVRTISALEQGTDHKPTRELLDAITSALRLGGDERRMLWHLAVGTPPPERDYTTDTHPALARLVDEVSPHPAYVCDAVWNIQYHNAGFAQWFFDASALPVDERNFAVWLVGGHARKHLFVDWESEVQDFIARIRGVQVRLPDDPRLTTMIETMRARSLRFGRLWDDSTTVASYQPARVVELRPPGHTDPKQAQDENYHMPVTMTVLSPITPGDDRRFAVFFLPDEYSEPAAVPSPQACTACARDQAEQP